MVPWDVVNEAVVDDGAGLRDSIFLQKLGTDYIRDAFVRARQADPHALLFYNDFLADGLNAKSDFIYDMSGLARSRERRSTASPSRCTSAAARRRPTRESVRQNLQRFAASDWSSASARWTCSCTTCRPAHAIRRPKAIYHSIVAACVAVPRCEAVTFWGFTDAHSWLNSPVGSDAPLLFDAQYAAKPAFYGVRDAFSHR